MYPWNHPNGLNKRRFLERHGQKAPGPEKFSPLHCILGTIRSFGYRSDGSSRAAITTTGDQDVFLQATNILKKESLDSEVFMIFEQLNTLPSRIAEALGRPDDVYDVLPVLAAIAAMIVVWLRKPAVSTMTGW